MPNQSEQIIDLSRRDQNRIGDETIVPSPTVCCPYPAVTCFRSSQLSPTVAPNHLAWSAVHPTIVVEDSLVTAQLQPPPQKEVVTLNSDIVVQFSKKKLLH